MYVHWLGRFELKMAARPHPAWWFRNELIEGCSYLDGRFSSDFLENYSYHIISS